MISKVLTTKGMSMDLSDLYGALWNCWSGDPFADKKAAGSIGGSVKNGFIEIDYINRTATRIR